MLGNLDLRSQNTSYPGRWTWNHNRLASGRVCLFWNFVTSSMEIWNVIYYMKYTFGFYVNYVIRSYCCSLDFICVCVCCGIQFNFWNLSSAYSAPKFVYFCFPKASCRGRCKSDSRTEIAGFQTRCLIGTAG